jgi:branched-chain amino acid transport system substrate-binding protein
VRRVALLSLAVLATALAGCGDDDAESSHRVRGDTLTVYASLPLHGEDAQAGKAAELGMRSALADAGHGVGDKAIRLVVLPSTRPEDDEWDPGTIEANAERAADDATTIAYLGELDQGGSAVSLPVTNRAGILQVSPADGLTSLTRTPPGRPTAGPDRYYPDGPHNFVRLVPPDLDAARAIVERIRQGNVRRLVVVDGARIADRELEAMVTAQLGLAPAREVTRVTTRRMDDPAQVGNQAAELTEEVVAARPDAIVFAAAAGPEATALLGELAAQLPDVPLWGGPPLALGIGRLSAAPSRACAMTVPVRPRRLSKVARQLLSDVRDEGVDDADSEALLGYDAMRLTLDAIADGGPERSGVIAAARATGPRDGLMGSYSIVRGGDPAGRRPVCAPLVPARG